MLIEVKGGYLPSERVKFICDKGRGNISIETLDGDSYQFSGGDMDDLNRIFSPIIPAPLGYAALFCAKPGTSKVFWADRRAIIGWRKELGSGCLIPIFTHDDIPPCDTYDAILHPNGLVETADGHDFDSFDAWQTEMKKTWELNDAWPPVQ
jgi:hypothetical protein